MTIRLDMAEAASRAIDLLGDSAELVIGFINGRHNPDGGFKGRTDQSDLYYTVFGIEALLALNAKPDLKCTQSFLQSFIDDPSLDLVHLACLARCFADVSHDFIKDDPDFRTRMANRIERYRSANRGYSNLIGVEHGTAYGCFLALGAYQDLEVEMHHPHALVDCIQSLQTPDGGYANEPAGQVGSTPATAAAISVLHYLSEPAGASSTNWLLRQLDPRGGFTATPGLRQVGIPDLLSTATALHALALNGVSIGDMKESCLDFLDSLWNDKGGFHGHWADETLDCEYTYYGLLALGHLSTS
ncbi:MAG: hypothetical protein JXM79_25525 [Sedimentisphaerales bacterium]|nr:hypothetical protein [Sedimentisphaerales bacterium]